MARNLIHANDQSTGPVSSPLRHKKNKPPERLSALIHRSHPSRI